MRLPPDRFGSLSTGPERISEAGRSAASGPQHPLHLPVSDFQDLLTLQGPSLALWRAAEIAALRAQQYVHPILDFGCGDGLVTSLVLRDIDYGVDPNVRALQRAAQRNIYRHLLPVPIEDMPVPDSSIATIISNSVVEHLASPDEALRAVARVLVPGGRFIFTTPAPMFSEWLVLPDRRYAAWRNRQLMHRTLLSAPEWAQRLSVAGLQMEAVRPYLRHELVWAWDAMELLQQIWIGRHRLVSVVWKRIPPPLLERLAERYASLDLSAGPESGGQLIVARKL